MVNHSVNCIYCIFVSVTTRYTLCTLYNTSSTYYMCVCSNRFVFISFHFFRKLIFAGCVPNLKNVITTLTNWWWMEISPQQVCITIDYKYYVFILNKQCIYIYPTPNNILQDLGVIYCCIAMYLRISESKTVLSVLLSEVYYTKIKLTWIKIHD